MQVYSRLHSVVKDTETRWHTESVGKLVYDNKLPPFHLPNTMLWVEEIAELFPYKKTDSGPQFFDTVMYPWGMAIDYFKFVRPLNVVPTLHYWVCQGHEWDNVVPTV